MAAGLDDLYAQVPTSEIATKLGADRDDVDSAVHTLVTVLVNGFGAQLERSREIGRAHV